MSALKPDWAAHGVDAAVARLWMEHGGDHHGPRTETVTMPMSRLMGFAAALRAAPASPHHGQVLARDEPLLPATEAQRKSEGGEG